MPVTSSSYFVRARLLDGVGCTLLPTVSWGAALCSLDCDQASCVLRDSLHAKLFPTQKALAAHYFWPKSSASGGGVLAVVAVGFGAFFLMSPASCGDPEFSERLQQLLAVVDGAVVDGISQEAEEESGLLPVGWTRRKHACLVGGVVHARLCWGVVTSPEPFQSTRYLRVPDAGGDVWYRIEVCSHIGRTIEQLEGGSIGCASCFVIMHASILRASDRRKGGSASARRQPNELIESVLLTRSWIGLSATNKG